MGKITKTVIEDVAYELKRVGLVVHAHNTGTMPEDKADEYTFNLSDPEEVIDWIIDNIHEVFATHDYTFNSNKFREQTAYRVDQNL